MVIDFEELLKECTFSASRSSGPGGQNVNKVNSKIELRFNIPGSLLLTDEQKAFLTRRLTGRITESGDLIITAQNQRSQIKNRNEAIQKFSLIIQTALEPQKKRKPTYPTIASRLRRREVKERLSEKKKERKKPEL